MRSELTRRSKAGYGPRSLRARIAAMRHTPRWRAPAYAAWLLLAPMCALPASAQPPPQPFTASYTVHWKGITAGTASLTLAHQSDSRYSYTSLIAARGIFRLVFPGNISQSSTFELVDDAVRPLKYRASDGAADKSRDVALEFDWAGNRVRGSAERAVVDVELRPGTLDPMSVQIAMMRSLSADGPPARFPLIEKSEIADYVYTREGTARIGTALGELDTVIWSGRRSDSNRLTRMWYAPSLGFIPVRAERSRGGKIELEMSIRALQRL
jgi:hypothetical protein